MEYVLGKWWICLSCSKRHYGRADHLDWNNKPLWKWCPKCRSSSIPEEEIKSKGEIL